MQNYTPPFSVTDEMLTLVASITKKIDAIGAARGAQSAKPRLRRNSRIRSIHSSLKIEANSLSLEDVRDVIDGRPVIGNRIEIQEVKNAYAAYQMLNELDPYSMEDLLRAHEVMTRYLLDESGVFRKGEEGVFSGNECIFIAPPARLAPQLMESLFLWLNGARESLHPLIFSSVFHYEIVFIHPFADGNGRMARLWHTALLERWRPLFEYIPLESQIEKFQAEYYDAIEESHSAGNSCAFIEFMLEQTDSLLGELRL